MEIHMDSIDRKIVRLLHDDGRRPNVDIARELGLSEGTIRKRIDRLLSSGTLHVRGLVAPRTMGLATHVLILLTVELSRLRQVSAVLAEMPETVSIRWLTGEYDLAVEAVFESDAQLMAFLNDRVGQIRGISRTQTAHVVHTEKERDQWTVPAGTEPTVLIVDDDPDFVEAARIVLKSGGLNVQSASNGSAALNSMIAAPPDLVILDIMMDGVLDGWDASWRIRSNPALRSVPILVVSSITSTDYLALMPTDDDNLIDNFLSKPVAPGILLSEARRLLERSGNGRSP
jgi:Lrp/AsnC family transcriptional regulator, regulator for asnA, asnC and gidA